MSEFAEIMHGSYTGGSLTTYGISFLLICSFFSATEILRRRPGPVARFYSQWLFKACMLGGFSISLLAILDHSFFLHKPRFYVWAVCAALNILLALLGLVAVFDYRERFRASGSPHEQAGARPEQ